MGLITLLTDFGRRDYYVAAVKGVILRRAPAAGLVDISHEVPPGDIATASFVLEAAFPCFPDDAVHLAVVDPGVGSGRRILIVETRDGARLVAPDNGLLTPFFDAARRIVAADREDLYRPAPGSTFHGRDRFAPLAAALVKDESAESCGAPIDDPVRLEQPPARRTPKGLHGHVRHVDRFGNLVTNLPADWLTPGAVAEIAGHAIDRVAACYDDIPPGAAALIVGSLGTLELSMAGESLASRWGVSRGEQIEVSIPGRSRAETHQG